MTELMRIGELENTKIHEIIQCTCDYKYYYNLRSRQGRANLYRYTENTIIRAYMYVC